ncbi:hypothetical protein R70006_04951 [Paraburkholderia domus]|uniref:hypothetical protein n=1 Tax=Paraburkholderia domus TaxID=2793075 RepID=UPI0019121A14|nr:hypothetical protein [Paraburkholderia domus]MBK5051813.1 hypothetical protein [Burkholderia sp. R-70006]CAE6793326.1 hypothetical protein R70006_04951 [Paraburkholderia domus]
MALIADAGVSLPLELSEEQVSMNVALARNSISRLSQPPSKVHVYVVSGNEQAPDGPVGDGSASVCAWIVDALGRKHESTLPYPLQFDQAEVLPIKSFPDDLAHLHALHAPGALNDEASIVARAEQRVFQSLVMKGGSERIYRKALTAVNSLGTLTYPAARDMDIELAADHLAEEGLVSRRGEKVRDAHGAVRGSKIFFERPALLAVVDDFVMLREAAVGGARAMDQLLSARGIDSAMKVAIRALSDSELRQLDGRFEALYEGKSDIECDRVPRSALEYSKQILDVLQVTPFKPKDAVAESVFISAQPE